MERKAKGNGERDPREKRNVTGSPSSAPPGPSGSPTTPGEASPSSLAAVRCARAALLLSSLRSGSQVPQKQGRRRELEGEIAAAEADPEMAAAVSGMRIQMRRLWRVICIQAAFQLLIIFVLCAFLLFFDMARPSPWDTTSAT